MNKPCMLSLFMLTATLIMPTMDGAAPAAQSKEEKTRKFKGFIKQYKDAKALYKKRAAEGAPASELQGYKQQMKIARKKAIAIFGAVAFAAAVAATIAYFALRGRGKITEANLLAKGSPELPAALQEEKEMRKGAGFSGLHEAFKPPMSAKAKEEAEKEELAAQESKRTLEEEVKAAEEAKEKERLLKEQAEQEAKRRAEEERFAAEEEIRKAAKKKLQEEERVQRLEKERVTKQQILQDNPLLLINAVEVANLLALENYLPAATKAQIDKQDAQGNTALLLAAKSTARDAYAMAQMLINNGASIDLPNRSGYTPLMVSISFRNKNVFNLLLSRGANVNAETNNGTPPIFFALYFNQPAMFNALLPQATVHRDKKIAEYSFLQWLLYFAHKRNDPNLIRIARERGATDAEIRLLENPAIIKSMDRKIERMKRQNVQL